VCRLIGRRIGPIVIAGMSQRHRSNAKLVVHAQNAEVVVDRVAPLTNNDSDEAYASHGLRWKT
jgi:hypothetical protein